MLNGFQTLCQGRGATEAMLAVARSVSFIIADLVYNLIVL